MRFIDRDFNAEFEKVVQHNRNRKQYKKELFDKNVKNRIVYIDEQGSVYKKGQNESKNEDAAFKVVCIILVIVMILMVIK